MLTLPARHPRFCVGPHSRSLIPIPALAQTEIVFRGRVLRVRIIKVLSKARPATSSRLQYLAPVSRLVFDPGRWTWDGGGSLYEYTAKKGRLLLHPRTSLSLPISEKWIGLVPANFEPDWREVWAGTRPRKEAAFLWSVYHRAVAVNHWRHRAFPELSAECTCCERGEPETIIHCFYECELASRAWAFVITILHAMAKTPATTMPWLMLSWEQCIFGVALPAPLHSFWKSWSLMRGAAMWIVWIQRNQCVFDNNRWPPDVLERTLWDAVLDLARMSWAKVAWYEQHQPRGTPKARREFATLWDHDGLFFSHSNTGIVWNYQRPRVGSFISR